MTKLLVGMSATILLVALVSPVCAGEHRKRVSPPYAHQPEGASFERHTTRGQQRMMLRETLSATLHQFARRPVESLRLGTHRGLERVGVRLAGCLPAASAVPPPRHQCPEAGGPCTPARITPLFDSEPAYRALLDLIASARCRIDLMIFGWGDDDAGRGVAAALIEKARSGVLVRVLIDRGGYVIGESNARVAEGCRTFVDALQAEPNIGLIQAPDPGFRFDHRKIAVIDDRIVWTGSMILTAPALHRWHNFEFLAEGPIVPQYEALFAERWCSLGGRPVPSCADPDAVANVAPNTVARLVRTDVETEERSLKEAVYGAVDHARHHIYLENPYFSDKILANKLVAARARGVDVRAVLTLRGDVRAENKLSTLSANHLLKGGCRVFLYPAMTHVKAMSVDGDWAY
ncbi:MAG TPA: phosphatidylserine/phosphatidylglycerophosphate/cardiolipin synthase family protein, partial [Isosphaeraceae bacterium]|nr:phosphatidylserine/phosphatidylglycerophosphate/cardiolipin synthase family protein [Isosphaeraceae bacterium]